MEDSASARSSLDDDPTVDEMMDALDRASESGSIYTANGFTEKAVEIDSSEDTEELIAPEVLFPDEAGSSDDPAGR